MLHLFIFLFISLNPIFAETGSRFVYTNQDKFGSYLSLVSQTPEIKKVKQLKLTLDPVTLEGNEVWATGYISSEITTADFAFSTSILDKYNDYGDYMGSQELETIDIYSKISIYEDGKKLVEGYQPIALTEKDNNLFENSFQLVYELNNINNKDKLLIEINFFSEEELKPTTAIIIPSPSFDKEE